MIRFALFPFNTFIIIIVTPCIDSKWYIRPDCLIPSAWEDKKKNKRAADRQRGMAILPLNDLDWEAEVPVTEVFDSEAAASAWLLRAESQANCFFANPIMHDGVVPQFKISARGRMTFPRPPNGRGAVNFPISVSQPRKPAASNKRHISPRTEAKVAKTRGKKKPPSTRRPLSRISVQDYDTEVYQQRLQPPLQHQQYQPQQYQPQQYHSPSEAQALRQRVLDMQMVCGRIFLCQLLS